MKRNLSTLVPTFELASSWILDSEKRVDARFYAQDAVKARFLIDQLELRKIQVDELGNHSVELYHRPRFKRKYVSKKRGKPFLTPTDVFMFPMKPRKHVVDPPTGLTVPASWILITCSGSVGRSHVSDSLISKCILSHDLVRLLPENEKMLGYLYAYLNTWIGQSLLTKNRYGATVKHIEPHHIAELSVPIIPELIDDVGNAMTKANKLKDEAQVILNEAESLLYSSLLLPQLDHESIAYFGDDEGRHVRSFTCECKNLDSRLDASYHAPLFHTAITNLEQASTGNIIRLDEVATSFVPPRFKRLYVEDTSRGVPMLQGSHISQMIPQDVKSVWSEMPKIKSYIIKKNWILVTCSGTIGRTALVRKNWNNWTATNHLLRIIANPDEIHPGYLTAFFLSDYGLTQFLRIAYGGVVDEIGEAGNLIGSIKILKPHNNEIEKKIGDLVFSAYDKRDQFVQIFGKTVQKLENKLVELSQ